MKAGLSLTALGITALLQTVSGEAQLGGSQNAESNRAGLVEPQGGYAEGVYRDYELGAGGRIAFEVFAEAAGPLSQIAEIPVGQLLSVPDYWITMDQLGTEITNLRVEERDPTMDEWLEPIFLSRFNEQGRLIDQGNYRLLSVETSIDSEQMTHQSLEVCWPGSQGCVVMDPVVLQLDAYSSSRRELLSQGWSIDRQLTSPSEGIDRVCSLNSHPSWRGEFISYPAFGWDLRNVFGMTLVHKDMAAQRVEIDCYLSGSRCLASPSGFSNRSSCWSTLGWNCSCGTAGSQTGVTGNAAKADSETRCTHAFLGSASASWSRNGRGASFSIQWRTSGGVTANGGDIYDACSWH